MMMIKTVKNPLIKELSKNGYCFKSNCSTVISLEQLAKEMVNYNSTFTEADNIGMLTVLKDVVKSNLAKGNAVVLPFGVLKPSVSGTCSSIQGSFSLGGGDNLCSISFTLDEETKKEIESKLEYKQVPPDSASEVRIYRVLLLKDDASEASDLNVKTGNTIRIRGRNLSFDIEDLQQGSFLENENTVTRISKYVRRGSNIIDFFVPEELTAGTYSLSVVTKPSNSYYTSSFAETIEIAE